MISPVFSRIWQDVPFGVEHPGRCCFLEGLCKTKFHQQQIQSQSKLSGRLALSKATLLNSITCSDVPMRRGGWWSVTSSEVHIYDCTPLSMLEFLLLIIKETTKWSRSGQRNLLSPAEPSSCVCCMMSRVFSRSSGFGVPWTMWISAILCWKTQTKRIRSQWGKGSPVPAVVGHSLLPPWVFPWLCCGQRRTRLELLLPQHGKKTRLEDTQGGNLVWPYANRHLFDVFP